MQCLAVVKTKSMAYHRKEPRSEDPSLHTCNCPLDALEVQQELFSPLVHLLRVLINTHRFSVSRGHLQQKLCLSSSMR